MESKASNSVSMILMPPYFMSSAFTVGNLYSDRVVFMDIREKEFH